METMRLVCIVYFDGIMLICSQRVPIMVVRKNGVIDMLITDCVWFALISSTVTTFVIDVMEPRLHVCCFRGSVATAKK